MTRALLALAAVAFPAAIFAANVLLVQWLFPGANGTEVAFCAAGLSICGGMTAARVIDPIRPGLSDWGS